MVFLQKRSQHLFWRSVCFHLVRVIAEELHVALAFSLLDTQKPPQLILQMITSRDKYVWLTSIDSSCRSQERTKCFILLTKFFTKQIKAVTLKHSSEDWKCTFLKASLLLLWETQSRRVIIIFSQSGLKSSNSSVLHATPEQTERKSFKVSRIFSLKPSD